MIFYLQHWEEVIKKMATEQEVFKGEVFHIAFSRVQTIYVAFTSTEKGNTSYFFM